MLVPGLVTARSTAWTKPERMSASHCMVIQGRMVARWRCGPLRQISNLNEYLWVLRKIDLWSGYLRDVYQFLHRSPLICAIRMSGISKGSPHATNTLYFSLKFVGGRFILEQRNCKKLVGVHMSHGNAQRTGGQTILSAVQRNHAHRFQAWWHLSMSLYCSRLTELSGNSSSTAG